MLMIAALYLGLAATPQACPGNFAVDARGMGPATLGQPVSALKAAYSTSAEAFARDGKSGMRYTVAICGDANIVATRQGNHATISRLSTVSPLFLTAKGAHVGMDLAELKQLYPRGKLNIFLHDSAETNFDTGTGVVFDLDGAAVPHGCYDDDVHVDCTPQLLAFKSVDVHIGTP